MFIRLNFADLVALAFQYPVKAYRVSHSLSHLIVFQQLRKFHPSVFTKVVRTERDVPVWSYQQRAVLFDSDQCIPSIISRRKVCASNYLHLDIVSTCLGQGLRPLLIAVAGGQQS